MTIDDLEASEEPEEKVAESPRVVWKHRRKDGSLIDVEVTSFAVTFGGRPALLTSVARRHLPLEDGSRDTLPRAHAGTRRARLVCRRDHSRPVERRARGAGGGAETHRPRAASGDRAEPGVAPGRPHDRRGVSATLVRRKGRRARCAGWCRPLWTACTAWPGDLAGRARRAVPAPAALNRENHYVGRGGFRTKPALRSRYCSARNVRFTSRRKPS